MGSSSHSKKRLRVSPEITRKHKSETGALIFLAKKPRTSFQLSSTLESEGESFDPTLEREDKDDFKAKVPRAIEYRQVFSSIFTAMLKRHPKPDVEAAMSPKLDGFVADFAGKKLDKARDSQLAKIQGAMLYAANPLTSLWAKLIEQGLANDPEAIIHVSDVLETIHSRQCQQPHI